MDLWIRSQHRKTLTKPCDLQMVHVNNGTEYAIISFTEMAGDIDLGIYKTKERALEVLNEIQELLMPKIVFKDEGRDYITPQGQIYKLNIKQPINTDMQELSSYVYEMPKD